ncbi:MAG: zf-HC2 domain-containing protein [Acidobacteriota bacterium]
MTTSSLPSSDSRLDEIVRGYARGIASEPHPDLDELEALLRGEVSSTEAERLESHLASCRDCSDQALDLAEFLEPIAAAEGASEIALAPPPAALEAVRRRLGRAPTPDRRSNVWPGRLLAAVLIGALIGLGWWNVTLQRVLSTPTLMDRVVLASSTVRQAAPPVVVIPTDRDLVLQLQPRTRPASQPPTTSKAPSATGFSAFLFGPSGQVLTTVHGQVTADPDISIRLPTSLLVPGEHAIVLWSVGEEQALWDEFRFEIADE